MATSTKLSPAELSAVVHHVELNRSGWWDRAVQRLVSAVLWFAETPLAVTDISCAIKNEFCLALTIAQTEKAVAVLETQNQLVRLPNDRFKMAEKARADFAGEVAAAENAAANARNYFVQLVEELCPTLDAVSTWGTFEESYLKPLVQEVGANTYRLVAGERLKSDNHFSRRFLRRFEDQLQSPLSETISRFFDPKRAEVRAYIIRLLHASFCVKAGGLPEEVIKKLDTNGGRQITFRCFVDTNVLFSLLNLDDRRSNSAANELVELIKGLRGNPQVNFVITPRTIQEAQRSISLTKSRLARLPGGNNFTGAALRLKLSGVAERFLEERRARNGNLSLDAWFDPYLEGFLQMARESGVELHNEKADGYLKRPEVVDDVNEVWKSESALKERGKTYELVQHDMVLWHMVADKRAAYVESIADAKDWILTLDSRLLIFDRRKQKELAANVPICLNPTTLIQILQFWIPQSKEFEEAVLGSLQLPFLFQDLDAEAERTSLRILEGIGKYEASSSMSEQAITRLVMDNGLRARISSNKSREEDAELIRDAYLEEAVAEADAAKQAAQAARSEAEERRAKLLDAGAELVRRDQAIQDLRGAVRAAQQQALDGQAVAADQQAQLDDLRRVMQEEQRAKAQISKRLVMLIYCACLAGLMTGSILIAWVFPYLFPSVASLLGLWPTRIACLTLVFLGVHLLADMFLLRLQHLPELRTFQILKGLRKWLWTFLVLGLLLSLIARFWGKEIEKNLERGTAKARVAAPEPSDVAE